MDNWPWFQEFFIDLQVFQGLHQDAVHTVLKYQKKEEPLHSKVNLKFVKFGSVLLIL